MSSSFNSYVTYIVRSIVLYMGISTVILGITGDIFNIIIFVSLKTFRENSCTFYLTLMSFVNIGHLITGQLTRVMMTGFNTDWTLTSLFYCKFRQFSLELFTLISLTCLCFATMDQFFATCSHIRWQQWNNIKLAYRLCVLSRIFWIIYCIPYLIFYNFEISSTTDGITCQFSNENFYRYHNYINNLILRGILPLTISIIFGILAYRNVRQISYRTVPLVRRELDKQLTNMVLIQIIFSFFFLLPYLIASFISVVGNAFDDPTSSAVFKLVFNATASIYYLNSAVSTPM
ncbi:unnamed protein product [Adineta ricciae]|uniref:G-protein coupled receptors family 1 profile domain-containing protein n=1 Tax=Adineta ricciae TaxID=249248 RepID=A0A816E4Q2_ADIRI|nr:unnamed protein product [Adineta ricciae]